MIAWLFLVVINTYGIQNTTMATHIGPTSELCHWVCSTQYNDLPDAVRKDTVTLLCDQVGAMIASANLPSCQPLVDLIRILAPVGECSIVGHPARTSVTFAALANGTIGHGAEADSTSQHGTGHYAAVTVATALTVGQYVRASGTELCRALALGSEVAGRIQSVIRRYGTRNQFGPWIGGTLGAAVSAGVLLGLNAEQMEHALGFAANGACGLSSSRVEELHQIKSLGRGKAAEAGVLGAFLARQGYHAPKEILTIENGFYDAFLGLPDVGHESVEGLGKTYLMLEAAYKRYPVGGLYQTPLYVLLQLMKTHKLTADDIESIEIAVSRGSFLTVLDNKPPSLDMDNILSLAAVYGEITFPHIYDPRYRNDPRVKAFRENTRILVMPKSNTGMTGHGKRLNIGMTVKTRDGRSLSEELRYPLMTAVELRQKFRDLVGLRLDEHGVSALEKKLISVESEKDVAKLVSELEIPY
jgi:2-methylcitrate dehydratase PrpD